ncbi:hypothetical protein [Tepidibacter formicigenes]|uniref:Uncharacterized protein n=1 Tax=Tepidibacter formicigenes DSM 15518 TaxID=1123349 RepID=A0A1M6T015_9FIRM|nr:hypothetical protein [Tepidibacter formicigenes]SHK50303.1 hypothetical protein SAMN02744037_02473 [Tepidibacter formicigenes DSM 15518]
MYIGVKQKINTRDECIYYFYLCRSYRKDGKVESESIYMCSLSEYNLKVPVDKLKEKFTAEDLDLLEQKVLQLKAGAR